MTTSIDDVIAKIHKLREYAARGATQGEMDNAASLIQKLMIEHNIEEAHLAIEAGEPLTGYGYTTISEKSAQWRTTLLYGIAKGNNCRLIMERGAEGSRGGGSKHVTKFDVFGHRDAVRVVIDLYREMAQAIEILSDREWAREAVMYSDLTQKRKWRNSWHHGAANTIYTRFVAQLAATQRESARTSTTLILVNTKVDETVAKIYPKLRKSTQAKYDPLADAYGRGREAGRDMNLEPTRKLS
jgi:hypothetical protein